MWFTDPKTKKKISFKNMLVHVVKSEVFLILLGKGGDPIETIPGKGKNAVAAYRACEKRGLVARLNSDKGDAFLDPEGHGDGRSGD